MNLELLQLVKKAALSAVIEYGLTDTCIGTVISVEPLSIKKDTNITLPSEFLVMTKNVSNYTTKIVLDGVEKEITIQNQLEKGDSVLLLKSKREQQYVVMDKL